MKKFIFFTFIITLLPYYIKSMNPESEENVWGEWQVLQDDWHHVNDEQRSLDDIQNALDDLTSRANNQEGTIKKLYIELETAQETIKKLESENNELQKIKEEHQRQINRTIKWALNTYHPKCVSILTKEGHGKIRKSSEDTQEYQKRFSTPQEALLSAIKLNSIPHIKALIPQCSETHLRSGAISALFLKRKTALNLFLEHTKQKFPSIYQYILYRIRNIAVEIGDLELLKKGCDKTSRDDLNDLAHFALDNCFKDGLKFLLEQGADIESVDETDESKRSLTYKALMMAQGFDELIMNHIRSLSLKKE